MESVYDDRMKQSLRNIFSNDFSEIIVDALNMLHTIEKSTKRIELGVLAMAVLMYCVTATIVLVLAVVGVSSLCKQCRKRRQRNYPRTDPWAHVLKSDKV